MNDPFDRPKRSFPREDHPQMHGEVFVEKVGKKGKVESNKSQKIKVFSNPHSPVNKNEVTITSSKSGKSKGQKNSSVSRFENEKTTKMKRNTINYAQNNH